MKTLSVVIPNFNGEKLLETYLPSLFSAISISKVEAEVIVVDDASTDASVLFLEKNYSEVIVLRNEVNSGFGTTCNKGFNRAKNDIILCLNSDMELREDFIVRQLPLFDDETVFAVMARIKSGKKTSVLESCKRTKRRSLGFKIVNQPDSNSSIPTESLFACGGNAFYERQKLLQLGGYSHLFGRFYFEDVDLCLRAWRMGWRTLYTSSTECYHQHSATIRTVFHRQLIKQTYYTNYLKMVYYHASLAERIQLLSLCRHRYLLFVFLSPFNYQFKAKKEAYRNFLLFVQTTDLFDNTENLYSYSGTAIIERLILSLK